MSDRFSSLFILCLSLILFVISACQSEPSGVSLESPVPTETAVATATSEIIPTEPQPSATPVPANTSVASPTSPPLSTDEPTLVPSAEPTETPESSPEPAELRTYGIVSDKSEVRFEIDEVLFGNPKTVVGRTDQVTGEIVLDLQNPPAVEVGTIQINARELVTDDSFRNRAIRRQILDSAQDEYQFITFAPTAIDGLNAQAAVFGEAQTFNLTGDLQIRDIVQTVTFVMIVTAVSETELNGFGETVVLRSDYDLQIPSVPGVANVTDEVKLAIEFVAETADN